MVPLQSATVRCRTDDFEAQVYGTHVLAVKINEKCLANGADLDVLHLHHSTDACHQSTYSSSINSLPIGA
jgi:hypothetical protein